MVALLIAGIAAFLAGILALMFGIPIKEFSFGNTMIITGAIVASAGMLTIGMWILGRELRALSARVGVGAPSPAISPRDAGRNDVAMPRPAPEPVIIGDITAAAPDDDDAPPPLPKASWTDPEPPAAEPPAAKPKRNLLFATSSRRERERAAAKAAEEKEAPAASVEVSPPPPPFDPAAAASNIPEIDPRDSFESAWPQAEVARPGAPSRRGETADGERPPFPPPMRPRPEPRVETRPPADITVLKSGVVDGMAYSLYSDGSIEAQMPEGMVRFTSIDELRAHLDGRA